MGCQYPLGQPNGVCMTTNYNRLLALLAAILFAAALRLLPHPLNFTPIGAIALFSGAYFGRKPLAFAAPLFALLVSDSVLGFYRGITTVYAADFLIVAIGFGLATHRSSVRIGVAAVASSLVLFTLTNFGMWLSSGYYPHTWGGLEACFVAAIPFFQNTLTGDLFYSLLLFGGFRAIEILLPQLRSQEPRAA